MLDLEDRLDELNQLGLHQRMRMVSGPQGPRVVLDGRPVLLLCSGNALGLADHPKVRQAAADAAMRWGVGAGAARVSCGTMTLHRRLEERLATFTGQRAALLFGSGALANMGVIAALARRGEIVLHDELSHSSILDGCRLSGAEVVSYRHADPDHLAWTLRQCDGRATLIATDGMFGMDGDVAPLAEIVELARRYDARVLVDEAHALGALGPGRARRGRRGGAGGRGRRHHRARSARRSAPTAASSPATTSPPASSCTPRARCCTRPRCRRSPPRPRWPRWTCWRSSRGAWTSCAPTPRPCATASPARASRSPAPPRTSCRWSSATPSWRCGSSTTRSSSASSPRPCARPPIPDGTARVRLSAMASHTRAELRGAATALGRAALRAGFRPGAGLPVAAAHGLARAAYDGDAAAPPTPIIRPARSPAVPGSNRRPRPSLPAASGCRARSDRVYNRAAESRTLRPN